MSAYDDYRVVLAGEAVRFMKERTLFWERGRTLFAADLHLGKEASFRRAAVPAPEGPTASTLTKLGEAVRRVDAARVVLLGDVFHDAEALAWAGARFGAWRAALGKEREILVVEGNHDRRANVDATVWGAWGAGYSSTPVVVGPFLARHDEPAGPASVEDAAGTLHVLCGHVHPGCVVGYGRERLTLPCFVSGPARTVAPALGEFTGLARVRPASGDRLFVVGDGVFPLPAASSVPS